MKNAFFFYFAVCAGISACSTPRSTTAAGSSPSASSTPSLGGKGSACATTGVPPVHFYSSRFAEGGVQNVPKKYDAFTVDAGEWKAFAQKVKERGPGEVTGLNIPLPGGCKNFSVTVSSTMSPELAAKYPDLISLKGNAEDGADLRLDWNGTQMRGQVILRGDTWLMEPYVTGAQIFYLVYHKADASATKKPFE